MGLMKLYVLTMSEAVVLFGGGSKPPPYENIMDERKPSPAEKGDHGSGG